MRCKAFVGYYKRKRKRETTQPIFKYLKEKKRKEKKRKEKKRKESKRCMHPEPKRRRMEKETKYQGPGKSFAAYRKKEKKEYGKEPYLFQQWFWERHSSFCTSDLSQGVHQAWKYVDFFGKLSSRPFREGVLCFCMCASR